MPRHPICLSALGLVILQLSGCILHGKIDAKGAGTMTIKYRMTTEAQLEPNKKRLESAHVKVTSATMDKDKWGTYEIKFDDITKLSSAAFFHTATITLTDGEAGTKVLTVKNVNKTPNKLPEEMVNYFGKEVRVALTLPGEIVTSNATSTDGQTVTWTYPLNDFTSAPELNLNVTFKAPQDGAAPAGDKPAAAGAAEEKKADAH